MLGHAYQVDDDLGVQSLNLRPQLVGGELLFVGDIKVQVPGNGLG